MAFNGIVPGGNSSTTPTANEALEKSEEIREEKKLEDRILEEEAAIAELRFQEQCLLTQGVRKLAKYNFRRNYDHFTAIHGDASRIITNLVARDDMQPFLDITTDQHARLHPEVRLFKTIYDEDGNEEENIEYRFADYLEEGIGGITKDRISRGSGVGIKSFEWKYVGSNPAESTNIIEAELKLRFESVHDFEVTRQGKTSKGKDVEYKFVDLLLPPLKYRKDLEHYGEHNPNYFTFKMVVGWADPKDALDRTDPRNKGLRDALDKNRRTLILNLTTHDIEFRQEGPVILTIKANARHDIASAAPESDIFRIYSKKVNILQEDLDKINEQKSRFERCNKNADGDYSEKDTAALNDLKDRIETLREDLKREKTKIYSALMKDLVDKDRVWSVVTSMNQLGGCEDESIWGDAVKSLDRDAIARKRDTGTSKVSIYKMGNIPNLKMDKGSDAEVSKAVDELGETLNESAKGSIDAQGEGSYVIPFVFLGDILDVALKALYGKDNPYTKQSKTLVGDIMVHDPRDKKRYSINLADVPVSVRLFQEWFIDHIYAKQLNQYPAKVFMKDVIEQLVVRAIVPGGCYTKTPDRRIKVSLSSMTLPNREDGKDRIDPMNCGRAIIGNDLQNFNKADTKDVDNLTQYHILYASEVVPSQLNGDIQKDIRNGIYHFGMGRDRGLIKTINFSRTDMPYLREARLLEGGEDNLFRRIREHYEAKIRMIGNELYYPGQIIFVNPSTIAFGDPANPNSAARQLGIAGYFQIVDVVNFIEPGNYETELKAIWVASGDTKKPFHDVDKKAKGCEAKGEKNENVDQVSAYSTNPIQLISPDTSEFICSGHLQEAYEAGERTFSEMKESFTNTFLGDMINN